MADVADPPNAGISCVPTIDPSLLMPLSTDYAPSVTSKCNLPSLDVLVVDDSLFNRKMLLKCLRADGHICIEGADGLEALAMVKERIGYVSGGQGKPFDVILMDFEMPNMDGPTATMELRALGYTSPIFGVTGNDSASDIAHYLNAGADKVILKPLDMNVFGQAMHSMIDKQH